MDIEKLAKELRVLYWGEDSGEICDDDIKLAKHVAIMALEARVNELQRISNFNHIDRITELQREIANIRSRK